MCERKLSRAIYHVFNGPTLGFIITVNVPLAASYDFKRAASGTYITANVLLAVLFVK